MTENIKKLSVILNESYNEKSLNDSLSDFFAQNFNIEGFQFLIGEDVSSDQKFFPLYKFNKKIGGLEFSKTNKNLEKFLDIALPFISLKLQNIVLSEKMQTAIDYQNSMKNIAKLIETQYDLSYIIPLIGEIIDKFMQGHLIYVYMKEKDGFRLVWPSVCKDEKVLDIINLKPLKRITNDDFGIFPMLSDNKLIGYIVSKCLDEKLSYKETEYMEELTKQAATTINRATAYAEVLKHAMLDALTGFYNRHQLDVRITQEIATSKRQKTPLCAIMVDIDFFKSINDTYGHAVGDLVLKTVAKVMRSQLREYDIAGRYGGEEFAFLLPFTNISEAKLVAERLRKSVERKIIDISKVNSEVTKKEISVTISLGIYQLKEGETDLLKNTDKALYKAKESGRNRVVIYEQQI